MTMAAAIRRDGGFEHVESELSRLLGPRLRRGEPLSKHTAFRLGGPAAFFAEVHTPEELAGVYRLGREESVPVFLLGRGTNLLVRDGGYEGIVVVLGGAFETVEKLGEESGKALVRAGAGALNAQLVKFCHGIGLVGIEFLGLIPGTVGGAVRMNAGAHGGEIREFLKGARIVTAEGKIEDRSLENLQLSYRRSGLAAGDAVAWADLLVPSGDVASARERMKEFSKHRTATQPLSEPNAGSIFKNPFGNYAGRLIESVGLKGFRAGGARVSELHANFIVGSPQASSADVEKIIEHVRSVVKAKTGETLELEIQIIGEPLPAASQATTGKKELS